MGAILTAALFETGAMIIAFYLARAQIGSAYGAAGSLVALLVWVYYSPRFSFTERNSHMSMRSRSGLSVQSRGLLLRRQRSIEHRAENRFAAHQLDLKLSSRFRMDHCRHSLIAPPGIRPVRRSVSSPALPPVRALPLGTACEGPTRSPIANVGAHASRH